MNLFHKLLLITLFLFNLNASESFEQIIITKTSHKSNLGAIKRKLDSINVKMFVQKVDSYYLVYSQRYSDASEANKSLQKINHYFPYARFVEKEAKHEDQQETVTKETSSSRNENNFFIALGVSLSNLSATTSDANASKLSHSGISYALEAGYMFNERIFATIGYMNSSTSDIDVNNIYAGVNYKMNFTNDLSMYVGFIGGFSTLELTGYPTSTSSSSALLDGQLGVMYEVTDYMSVYSVYKGLLMSHSVELIDAGSSVEFSFLHNLQTGVRFKF